MSGVDVTARFNATMARIGKQVDVNKALTKERIAALKWCRENGNPHIPTPPKPEQV